MDKKLTDSEIIKALECAIRNDCDCNCVFLLPNKVQDVLDLINRLEARIGVYETCNARKDEAIKHLEAKNERLKTDFENSQKTSKYWHSKCGELAEEVATAKAEAYKECIDMVKKKGVKVGVDEICIFEGTLDNLLKETVGDTNA